MHEPACGPLGDLDLGNGMFRLPRSIPFDLRLKNCSRNTLPERVPADLNLIREALGKAFR
jgi:hypothetical protein